MSFSTSLRPEYSEHQNDNSIQSQCVLPTMKEYYVCCGYVEIKCQLGATDDFYCRSYCLFNMFRAPLCPSSGAREYYTSACCLSYLVLWFSSCRYGVELRVVCPVCGLQPANRTNNPQLHTIPTT